MVHPDRQCRPLLEPTFHVRVQFETQKMHGASFLLVLPFQILIGDGLNGLATFHLDPDPVLDAFQTGQHVPALFDVGILDQHRRLEVAPVRYQRVVGFQFAVDTLVLEDFLDPQHFLHLITKRQFVFENQGQVIAQRQGAPFFVGEHPRPKSRALPGVLLQRHQAVSSDGRHDRLPKVIARRRYG